MESKRNTKVEIKKNLKENDLCNAAFELFTTKGIKATAIDDIVRKAGVAKGTFYLYFKDKHDILNRLILRHSSKIVKEAMEETARKNIVDFEEMVLFYVNYIIELFKDSKLLLKLINKNFSWGIYRREIMKPEEHKEMQQLIEIFIKNMKERGMGLKEAEITLFMIIELVGTVCYSSIILGEPYEIDEVKPHLCEKIINMLRC
ncbi:transcriptional regulator, TetR family [Clostridium cavendishii DSM 21758]|uniref:Transcriptional regulator, TetR family n=1 Tax=Clostridium cavendishii DSM 21758 TaxID=1121302 RepID=A0A1M6BAU7_9CLOT|nr:TetR/AcrR family transcriptional regulator [Clostridium cavendishii]SHI45835.1 transcriptional regulator, TetR family [Clostridium cavendishii DSM 21758]